MTSNIKGTHCPHLRFSKILRRWVSTNIRFSNEGYDNPWYYNERALISLFAGAVWAEGGLALEEFSVYKRTGKKRKPLYSGRSDLYLSIGNSHFIAEVKHAWSGATRVSIKTATYVQDKLSEACDDIRKYPREKLRKLGILFAMPYFSKSYIRRWGKKPMDEQLQKWVTIMKENIEYSCVAWVFPQEARDFRYKTEFYPGIAVFIKEV